MMGSGWGIWACVVVAGSEDGREVVVKVVGGLVEVVRSRISFRAYPMLITSVYC